MGKDRRAFAPGKMGGGRLLKAEDFLRGAGMSAGISFAAAELFYGSLWGLWCAPIITFLVFWMQRKKREEQRQRRLALEFKDYLCALAAALTAGHSIERAFLTAMRETDELYGEASVLAGELAHLEQRLFVQEPLEHILRDFAEKSGNEDIESFVEIFCHAKRGGGDFLHIIRTSAGRICDKIEVSEEINTVMAEKAMEQKIMCVVPFGVLLFFRISAPEFIGRLYGNMLGIVLMSFALLMYGAAYLLAVKIVRIEV